MELNFKWNKNKVLLLLAPVNPDKDVIAHGWIEVSGVGYAGNKPTGYRVWISTHLTKQSMPCETQDYVTLRQAMRALKDTVTVLLIGREYGA